jgi:hypothetical protein
MQVSLLRKAPVKTGKMLQVQVLNSKGVANHTGPESCAEAGNCLGEALTGERAGRVLSREMETKTLERRRSRSDGRPHRAGRQREAGTGSTRSETPYMRGNILRGNRESPCLPVVEDGATGRIGKSEDASRWWTSTGSRTVA